MGVSLWDKWPNGKMARLLNEGGEANLRLEIWDLRFEIWDIELDLACRHRDWEGENLLAGSLKCFADTWVSLRTRTWVVVSFLPCWTN